MTNTDHLLKFEDMEFEKIQDGLEQKKITRGDRVLRILKIHSQFTEANWCLNGHVGYVLSGKMKINFNGIIQNYNQGDGLWIEQGESSKHKVIMEEGEEVQLILFESLA